MLLKHFWSNLDKLTRTLKSNDPFDIMLSIMILNILSWMYYGYFSKETRLLTNMQRPLRTKVGEPLHRLFSSLLATFSLIPGSLHYHGLLAGRDQILADSTLQSRCVTFILVTQIGYFTCYFSYIVTVRNRNFRYIFY